MPTAYCAPGPMELLSAWHLNEGLSSEAPLVFSGTTSATRVPPKDTGQHLKETDMAPAIMRVTARQKSNLKH